MVFCGGSRPQSPCRSRTSGVLSHLLCSDCMTSAVSSAGPCLLPGRVKPLALQCPGSVSLNCGAAVYRWQHTLCGQHGGKQVQPPRAHELRRNFYLRDAGTITPPNTVTTTYTFGISSDDASSLYIDGVNIANDPGAPPQLPRLTSPRSSCHASTLDIRRKLARFARQRFARTVTSVQIPRCQSQRTCREQGSNTRV